MEESELYTTQQAASMLGVSSSRIRQLIMLGEAKPLRKFGITWMFDRAEIERLHNRPKSKGGRGKKRPQA